MEQRVQGSLCNSGFISVLTSLRHLPGLATGLNTHLQGEITPLYTRRGNSPSQPSPRQGRAAPGPAGPAHKGLGIGPRPPRHSLRSSGLVSFFTYFPCTSPGLESSVRVFFRDSIPPPGPLPPPACPAPLPAPQGGGGGVRPPSGAGPGPGAGSGSGRGSLRGRGGRAGPCGKAAAAALRAGRGAAQGRGRGHSAPARRGGRGPSRSGGN